jgi:hypothetical protein
MAQIFHRSTNTISKVSIYGAVFIICGVSYALYKIEESPWYTEANEAREQPVPFSHKHHASELGIDCRYCHTSVERSAFAGLPPTATCMTCHSQIWVNAPMLEPVRSSFQTDRSLGWTRVNALPEFVYFNHSIHVKKGVGCTTCHGPVGDMPITWRANTLYMGWCLDCHRHPELYLRPRARVFDALYTPPPNQVELGRKLIKEYKVKAVAEITSCYTCHR